MQSKNCFHASKLTNDGLRWSGRPGPRRVIFSAPHKLPDHTKSKSHDFAPANQGRLFSRAEFVARFLSERSMSPPVAGLWLPAGAAAQGPYTQAQSTEEAPSRDDSADLSATRDTMYFRVRRFGSPDAVVLDLTDPAPVCHEARPAAVEPGWAFAIS